MFKKAYIQLTLWYLAIVMTISIMFSFALFNVVSSELSDGLKRESARIYNQYPIFHNESILHPNQDLKYEEHVIILRLISFNIIVLVSAGFASYFLARKTLYPIEEAHHQQKIFTANVSHELRTPLTALKMEDEVVLMNNNASLSELKSTIKSNLEEVEKIESLINSILRLTKLENDELRSEFRSIELNEVVEQAISTLTPIATKKNITINLPETKKYSVFGNKESLVQLLIILLDNSVKYSRNSSKISISVEHYDKKQILISIVDNGVGINKDKLKQVFDRFYQADLSRNNQTEGYGLGLSIAKSIVDLHNGNIVISSIEDKGTTVRVYLPIKG